MYPLSGTELKVVMSSEEQQGLRPSARAGQNEAAKASVREWTAQCMHTHLVDVDSHSKRKRNEQASMRPVQIDLTLEGHQDLQSTSNAKRQRAEQTAMRSASLGDPSQVVTPSNVKGKERASTLEWVCGYIEGSFQLEERTGDDGDFSDHIILILNEV